jgi:hypothetical protein
VPSALSYASVWPTDCHASYDSEILGPATIILPRPASRSPQLERWSPANVVIRKEEAAGGHSAYVTRLKWRRTFDRRYLLGIP